LQIDLARLDRTVPVAGYVGSSRELMGQGDAERFDIGLLGSTRILQLRLQLQRSFPDIKIEKEQTWPEFESLYT
jgi:hypothetical protein